MQNEITIILDNGGGITLQINGEYQVTTNDHNHAAQMIKDAQAPDCDMSDWEGNEIEENGLLEPSCDEIRNGGYRVYDLAEFMATEAEDVWGNAGRYLREAL
jgi:hypothetical protein